MEANYKKAWKQLEECRKKLVDMETEYQKALAELEKYRERLRHLDELMTVLQEPVDGVWAWPITGAGKRQDAAPDTRFFDVEHGGQPRADSHVLSIAGLILTLEPMLRDSFNKPQINKGFVGYDSGNASWIPRDLLVLPDGDPRWKQQITHGWAFKDVCVKTVYGEGKSLRIKQAFDHLGISIWYPPKAPPEPQPADAGKSSAVAPLGPAVDD